MTQHFDLLNFTPYFEFNLASLALGEIVCISGTLGLEFDLFDAFGWEFDLLFDIAWEEVLYESSLQSIRNNYEDFVFLRKLRLVEYYRVLLSQLCCCFAGQISSQ